MTELLNIALWTAAAAWIVFLAQGLVNARLVPNLARLALGNRACWPAVSYVVPARNEEAGIAAAVTSFCTQDYPELEVIVVDDRSTDRTAEILEQLRGRFANLTVVQGQDPPPGWLGKPHALEAGRARARGEWVVMADADAVHAPEVLRRAVAWGMRRDAGMVAVRPSHVTRGVLEAALMSGVNFFFFFATPMFLVQRSRSVLFATGSPVFNLIRRDALEACGGFACLRQAVVDDLEIGFRVKQAGYRLAVAFAGTLIRHRMYPGARATIRGFAKTTYPTIRSAPWLLPLYLAAAVLLSAVPYCGFLAGLAAGRVEIPAALALLAMHAVFAGVAWLYLEPWYVTFLNPLRELGWVWIFVRSFVLYHRKGLVWRGRSYPASSG